MGETPKASVGRVVHYMSYGTPGGEYPSVARAAIIADVYDANIGSVKVVVFNPTGLHFNDALYSESPKPGCWSWPPRV